MADDFEAKEKEGIIWVKWKKADMELIVLPVSRARVSETEAHGGLGPQGVTVGGDKKQAWSGESIVIVTHSGDTNPYHIWEQKRGIESGLKSTTGIDLAVSTISTTGGTIFASGQTTCPRCGKSVMLDVPHDCTFMIGPVSTH